MSVYLRLMPLLLLLMSPMAESSSAKKAGAEGPGPHYFELKPSLVVNLAAGGKYLRCDIQLMTMDGPHLASIELHAPAIRHELLMLLSEQDGAKLLTAEGKEELRKKSLELTQKILKEQTARNLVDELYFTSFFIQ